MFAVFRLTGMLKAIQDAKFNPGSFPYRLKLYKKKIIIIKEVFPVAHNFRGYIGGLLFWFFGSKL